MNKVQLKHKILSKTVQTPNCWFYTGTKASGYGAILVDGKRVVAHRLMWEIENGPIPKGKELDHLCAIKHCVNPEHLQPVTHLENTRRGPQANDNTFDKAPKNTKKAYCIYISDERFREEKHKSALLNRLYQEHLDKVSTPRSEPEVKVSPVKPIVAEAKNNFEFCKHSSIKGLCKKGCK